MFGGGVGFGGWVCCSLVVALALALALVLALGYSSSLPLVCCSLIKEREKK